MGNYISETDKKTIHIENECSVKESAISPGTYLNENVLKPLALSVAELAKAIEVPPNRLYQIINGTREITTDTALRLGHFFETGPEMWLYMQWRYTLEKEREDWKTVSKNLPTFSDR
tara:strand:- start:1732 stop:2082 length:351 start_codon:yes stop_codon:yes gene_type:complete